MKLPNLLTIILLIISLIANAEVTLDGSLGHSGALPGPNYLIGADLGRQHGGNLFHSFKDFNLSRFESATFSGPNSINNIISRVTGGTPSNIDGLIRSTIPANMYFLNPYGIIFGPNAKLDVQGSFHASTADYLRLGDGGRFDARYPSESLLTIAPIEAFGFLDNTVASISVSGQGQEITDWDGELTGLNVLDGKTLSLVGGDIEVKKGNYVISRAMFSPNQFMPIEGLNAPSGQINLVSVASPGEVVLTNSGLDISQFDELGDITISKKSLVNVSGNGLGNLFIRANQLLVNDNSSIQAEIIDNGGPVTTGNANSINIDIQVENLDLSDRSRIFNTTRTTTNAGQVLIQANNITLTNGRLGSNTVSIGNAGDVSIKADRISVFEGGIFSITTSHGDAGKLYVQANEINLINDGRIGTDTISTGRAGDVSVQANNIFLNESGMISSRTSASGNAGHIYIHVTDKMMITGANHNTALQLSGLASGVMSGVKPSGVMFREIGDIVGGIGGDIVLEAGELILEQGGVISSSTVAPSGMQSERAGNITIRVFGNLKLSGVNPYGENSHGLSTGIYTRTKGKNAGEAGNISIEAESLSLTDGAIITSNTNNSAQGGHIDICVNGPISISKNSADIVLKEGGSYQQDFQKEFANYQNRIAISGIYAHSESTSANAGQAGKIQIAADRIDLIGGASINTSTKNADGGNITLTIPNLLYLHAAEVTTSVHGGKDDGGNITIENPHFVVLNQSKLQANADEGQGGNIYIKSGQFVTSKNSLVSASSKLGIDGEIKIDSPDVDISGAWLILPAKFVDASGQLKPLCSARVGRNKNSFVAKRFAGGPSNPSDLQANMLILVQPEDEKMPLQKTSGGKKDARQSVLKVVSFCRPDSSQATSSVIPEQLF